LICLKEIASGHDYIAIAELICHWCFGVIDTRPGNSGTCFRGKGGSTPIAYQLSSSFVQGETYRTAGWADIRPDIDLPIKDIRHKIHVAVRGIEPEVYIPVVLEFTNRD